MLWGKSVRWARLRKLSLSTLPNSMDQGVDEFITRGLNIVAWMLVFFLAPETKEYTLEELDSICEFPTLGGCCQSRVLICNSWRPYATIRLPQGGVRVQSHQVSGLRPRHCLQRPLRRQTARLGNVTVVNFACPPPVRRRYGPTIVRDETECLMKMGRLPSRNIIYDRFLKM